MHVRYGVRSRLILPGAVAPEPPLILAVVCVWKAVRDHPKRQQERFKQGSSASWKQGVHAAHTKVKVLNRYEFPELSGCPCSTVHPWSMRRV